MAFTGQPTLFGFGASANSTRITTTTQPATVFANPNRDNISTFYRNGENSEKFYLPSKVSATLKCSCCQAYLSCGPIREQNGKYICGRCPAIADDGISAQSIFELAMAKFTFPCRFDINGCDENILFNQTKDHESKCYYRNVTCPSLNCKTLVSASKLYDHFLKLHAACVIENNEFRLDLRKSSDQSLLINESDQLILVKYTFFEETKFLKIHISVIVERIRKINKYKLQFISDVASGTSINLPPKFCHACNSENLDSAEYDFINVNNYLPVLNHSNFVNITISFLYSDDALLDSTFQVKCDILSIPESDDTYERNAVEFMKTNSCLRCKKPPTVCQCSNISNPKIPCQWKGCKTIGDKQAIIDHQKDCKFKLHVCPFLKTCDKGIFFFNLSYINHLKTHAQYFPDSKNIVIPLYHSNLLYTGEKVYNYFTTVFKAVIVLNCTISPYDWAINCYSENKFQVKVHLTHEHCRFVSKINDPYRTSFKKSDFILGGCFDKFPRLTACIEIVMK